MSIRKNCAGQISLALATTLAAAGGALLIAMVIMGLVMADQMGSDSSKPSQTPVAVDGSAATVEISGFEFVPRELSVPTGATVTWTNRDSAPHNAVARGGKWKTGNLGNGESEVLTFNEPGTYRYLCSIHPEMTGTLTIR